MQEKLITITAQIPKQLDKDLTMVCKVEERSKSYIIRKALEKLVAEKLEDIDKIKKKYIKS